MRFFGWSACRGPILAGLLLALGSVPARAQVLYWETSDWVPTASILALPTSYVAGSSYVLPTSYVYPTVYATAYVTESALVEPTTYLMPTYYETRFRRRGLFGRRLVETTRAYYAPTTAYSPTAYYIPTTAYYPTTYYYPTRFYAPTVLDTGVLSTGYSPTRSSDCCGTMIAANTSEVRSYPAEQAPAAAPTSPRTNARTRSTPLQSQSTDDETFNSNVPELPTRESRNATQDSGTATRQSQTPPIPQVPTRDQSTAGPGNTTTQGKTGSGTTGSPATGSGTGTQQKGAGTSTRTSPAESGSGRVELPQAPADDFDLQKAPGGTDGSKSGSGGQHTTQKPVYTTRVLRSEYRNVLFGRVKARGTSEPEEGVRVTVTNRTSTYADRVTMTDAFGRFAVRVPDGDWTVNVTMPSGRSYSVSDITVSNGLISDDIGRDIPSLVITR